MMSKTLCKQVSRQRTFEDSKQWTATDCVVQTVRCSWSSDREGAVAHCWMSCRRHVQTSWWRRAQSADGDVVPCSWLGRWRFADKPVCTACTGCAEASAASDCPQVTVWSDLDTARQLWDMRQRWWKTAVGPDHNVADWRLRHPDTMKLERSVNSVGRGSDRWMLRICWTIPRDVHTNRVTCDLTDMWLSRLTLRSRTKAAGVTWTGSTAKWCDGNSWWRHGGTDHMNSVFAAFSWRRFIPIQLFDAAAKVTAERCWVVRTTAAVYLYVVIVLMRCQTLALDDADNVSRVHHEEERAQHGPACDWTMDGVSRLLAAVTRMLLTLV